MTCPICLRGDLPDTPCHDCQVLSDQAAARAAQVASTPVAIPLPDVDPLAFEAASRWDDPPDHMADAMDRYIAEAKSRLNSRRRAALRRARRAAQGIANQSAI